MRAHPESEHRLALPIASVVTSAPARPGIARDLVSPVAGRLETPLDLLDHRRGEILVRGRHSTVGGGATEGCRRLEGQLVGRDVLRPEGDQRIEIAVEVRCGLIGSREDQVEGEIREARGTRGVEGRIRDVRAMGPAESLQQSVVEGLHADREPVHAGVPEARQPVALDGRGVEFEGDLDGVGRAGFVRKRRTDLFDEPRDRLWPEERRRTAA